MSVNAPEYDDPDYVQVSQLCEICGDRWYGDRPLKQWSKHPNVTVHVDCDEVEVETKLTKNLKKTSCVNQVKPLKKKMNMRI